jgi:hypothetical protein
MHIIQGRILLLCLTRTQARAISLCLVHLIFLSSCQHHLSIELALAIFTTHHILEEAAVSHILEEAAVCDKVSRIGLLSCWPTLGTKWFNQVSINGFSITMFVILG